MGKAPPGKTPLNKISLGELRRQRKRTGLGSVSIVKLIGKEAKPPAPHVIDNWVSGNQPYADARQFELVMTTYMAQASLSSDGTGPDEVAVTDELRDELRVIHARSPSGYLEAAPQKFSASQMSHLLSGRTKRLSRSMLEFFRNDAQNVPEHFTRPEYPPAPDLTDGIEYTERPESKYAPRKPIKGLEYVEITDARHKELHGEVMRTRVSPRLLLKSRLDVPKGLRIATVQYWYSGTIRSAETAYWNYVIEAYGDLPSA